MVYGYSIVFATVVASLALWVFEMARAGQLHTNPWVYPAKVGSHGTLMLMCWAFILSTRFRIVESLFGGLDRVYRAHRVIGEIAFFLIFLHPIFLAVAFTDSIGEFAAYLWFSTDPVRNTGLVALIAFAVLVVLSIYWKIRYHIWKRTHDLFGVLLVLVLIHAAISGGEMARYPVLTAWYGSWSAAALAAYVYIRVLYRFVGPQYDVVVSGVELRADDITEVFLKPVGRRMKFDAGQFIYVSFDSDAVTGEPHPFSVSSPPEDPTLRLSIKRLGDWTGDVHRIRAGERARVWGPYGHFGRVLREYPALPVVMIGGGVGVTPLLSIIGSAAFAQRPGEAVLIYSTPTAAKQVYADELTARAEALPSLRVVLHRSDDEGFITTDYLRATVDRPLREFIWMLCGPDPMIESICAQLQQEGVPSRQVSHELFSIR
jgi:predicted ferric reductase